MAIVRASYVLGNGPLTDRTDKSALELAAPPQPSGLDQIIALVGRSDSIVVKSEGTRVIGYVVKSLWRAVEQCSPEEMEPMRAAMTRVASAPAIQALAEMLARNRKHVILLNESILALTLLSGQSVAGMPDTTERSLYLQFYSSDSQKRTCCSCPGVPSPGKSSNTQLPDSSSRVDGCCPHQRGR